MTQDAIGQSYLPAYLLPATCRGACITIIVINCTASYRTDFIQLSTILHVYYTATSLVRHDSVVSRSYVVFFNSVLTSVTTGSRRDAPAGLHRVSIMTSPATYEGPSNTVAQSNFCAKWHLNPFSCLARPTK